VKVLYIDDDTMVCEMILNLNHGRGLGLEILTTTDHNVVLDIIKINPDIKTIIMDGSMADHPEIIMEMKRILSPDTQFIGVSCDQNLLEKLGKAGCDKIHDDKRSVLRLVQRR
jgi:CheY-like chemotaxis protein